MNAHFDLVDDMPEEDRRALAGDLLLLVGDREPTRNEVIALRIAGDPEILDERTPLGIGFKVVLQLVDYGLLDEEDISLYDLRDSL